jgi:transposase-like protein
MTEGEVREVHAEREAEERLAPFKSEASAYRLVERCVWPRGPVCPHCGAFGRAGQLKGSTTRIGSYKCYACRKPFTVKVGTVLQSSNLPMHKWLQAIFLARCNDNPPDASRLRDALDVAPRTAQHVLRRVTRDESVHTPSASPGNEAQGFR